MAASAEKRCIGVFDSGLGGLTVVRHLMAKMPQEDIVYLGDSARVPYGTKSGQTVRRFAVENAAFLMQFDPKLIVIACNTASAYALEVLSEILDVPVIGTVAPGAKLALSLAGDGAIGIIATEGAIASGAYQRHIEALCPGRKVLTGSCPLLVPIIEEGRDEDDPIVLAVLTDYLRALQRSRPSVLILGCTHYPLLAGAIGKLMGPHVKLLDSGYATALEVKRHLVDNALADHAATPGLLHCWSTDNPRRFEAVAGTFLGQHVAHVRQVDVEELISTTAGEI